jgi:hypothetical protein
MTTQPSDEVEQIDEIAPLAERLRSLAGKAQRPTPELMREAADEIEALQQKLNHETSGERLAMLADALRVAQLERNVQANVQAAHKAEVLDLKARIVSLLAQRYELGRWLWDNGPRVHLAECLTGHGCQCGITALLVRWGDLTEELL